jgi:hypothetical protein
MQKSKYSYIEIGTMLLDAALKLYYEGHEYFSSLVLAKAAESVLGQELENNAYKQTKKDTEAMYEFLNGRDSNFKEIANYLNYVANRSKHGREDKLSKTFEGGFLNVNAKQEAEKWIDMAISDCVSLNLTLTSNMKIYIGS